MKNLFHFTVTDGGQRTGQFELELLTYHVHGDDPGGLFLTTWQFGGIRISMEVFFLDIDILEFCSTRNGRCRRPSPIPLIGELGMFKMVFESVSDFCYVALFWRFDYPIGPSNIVQNAPFVLDEIAHQYRIQYVPVPVTLLALLQSYFQECRMSSMGEGA